MQQLFFCDNYPVCFIRTQITCDREQTNSLHIYTRLRFIQVPHACSPIVLPMNKTRAKFIASMHNKRPKSRPVLMSVNYRFLMECIVQYPQSSIGICWIRARLQNVMSNFVRSREACTDTCCRTYILNFNALLTAVIKYIQPVGLLFIRRT